MTQENPSSQPAVLSYADELTQLRIGFYRDRTMTRITAPQGNIFSLSIAFWVVTVVLTSCAGLGAFAPVSASVIQRLQFVAFYSFFIIFLILEAINKCFEIVVFQVTATSFEWVRIDLLKTTTKSWPREKVAGAEVTRLTRKLVLLTDGYETLVTSLPSNKRVNTTLAEKINEAVASPPTVVAKPPPVDPVAGYWIARGLALLAAVTAAFSVATCGSKDLAIACVASFSASILCCVLLILLRVRRVTMKK